MYIEVDYERSLLIRVDHYCLLLYSGAFPNDEIGVDIDLSCMDFSFDTAWSVERAQY